MTITSLAERRGPDIAAIESVLIGGDLSRLTSDQRISYYNMVCQSLGLNPLTKPFAFITLNGKLTLYALKDATEQLRKIHGVSIVSVTSQRIDDVFVVTANAQDRTGRTDAAIGAVAVANLKGVELANALMKAETKAKRRATLSICGLGMLDETEADTLVSREPQYTVEAPQRVALPAGTVQILKVVPKAAGNAQWAEVTFVTAEGEEQVLPTRADGKGAAASTLEQLAQEGAPVVLKTAVTPRSKKTVIESARRLTEAAAGHENDTIDAEIAAKEAAEHAVL